MSYKIHTRGQSSLSSLRSQPESGPSSLMTARASPSHNGQAPLTPISPTRQPTHVQAIHDFDPSLLASTSSSNTNLYLGFKAGEIIRVHVRDATGWWDGEISGTARWVTEGEETTIKGLRRGWFPSNYVREMGWDGSFHRRTESAASASASSPTTRQQHQTNNNSHSRQTSAASHLSRASTSTTASASNSHYPAPSPPNRSNASSLPPAYQTLMHPIVQSLSLLESAIHSNRKPHIQPSTACVISSIRAALQQTDCLSKESSTLSTWTVLAKERKHVLVELSKLVNCARSASGTTDPLPEGYDEAKEMESLTKAARGVFGSVKRFLLLANDCGVEPTLVDQPSVELETNGAASSTSASENTPSPASGQDRHSRVRPPSGGSTRLQEAFRMRAASIGDLRAARQRAASPPPPMPSASAMSTTNSSTGSLRVRTTSNGNEHTPISATFSALSARSSPPPSARSLRDRRMQGASIDSAFTVDSSDEPRTSWDDTTSIPTPQPTTGIRQLGSIADVHDAIGLAEDALLSIIAAFIGHIHSHHIGSHPSSHAHLIEMTRETIDSVRELLTIVEAVGRNQGVRQLRPREIESLRVAKDQLYDVASRLVESAELVAHAPFSEFGGDSYDLEKAKLLQTATGTLRAGTECVRIVGICLPDDDDLNVHATPRQIETGSRQSTPRPTCDTPLVLRDKPVGQRGVHTLSGLHRKATSLSNLQKRYQQDGSLVQAPMEADEDLEDEDDEEVVQDPSRDEDLTMRPAAEMGQSTPFPTRPSFSRTHTTPVQPPISGQPAQERLRRPSFELLRTFSDNGSGVRSRSSSLTSPAPPRMKHRSPSRSADLDKFTNDFDVPSASDRRASRGTIFTGSRLSIFTSASSVTSTTQGSVRSSNLSDLSTAAPQTPLLGESSVEPDFSKGSSESLSSINGALSKIADLTLTDATPVKSHFTLLRPSPPVRRSTAPMPTANTDVRFWLAAHDYDPREITFNAEGSVVGASLTVLVEKMTPHDGPVDPTFGAIFFFTFRMFTTPMKLLEAILERYNLQPPQIVGFGERERAIWVERKVVPVRLRIYNFLKTWLEQHWRSDVDDAVLDTMEGFARDVVCATLPAMGPRLLDVIRRKQNGPPSAKSEGSSSKRSSSFERLRPTSQPGMLHPPVISGGLPPTPVISKNLHTLLQKAATASTNLNIAEFDTVELARQFTIMESKMFAAVAPEDLLQTGKKTIPELKALSTLSNQITGWVADSILNETDAKKRAILMKFFIKLADKCLMLNNFSTLFAVLAGLNSSTILRLKKTWDALSSKYRIIIERLRGIIEHTKNHAAYRARLREAPTPCLPFLGLILTDITFTSDGNPNTRPSTLSPDLTLINQDKYTKLGKIAMDFMRYQEPFNFHEIEAVQTFLRRVLTERGSGSIDALYRKSLMLEPRQGSERFSSNVERPNWLSGKI